MFSIFDPFVSEKIVARHFRAGLLVQGGSQKQSQRQSQTNICTAADLGWVE
jgi:hypothetical protein